ncbi:MAG: hypothetical protein M3094_03880 [Actinomycetia bacterium]|nr:hypothetical protein [Actinomycetes bacterium]
MRRPLILLSTVVLAVALLVVNVTWWMDSEVIDEEAFVASAVVVFNQPSSREAIATIVVERLVDEIRVLMLVDDLLIDVFSELLGTPQLQDVLVLVSEELHQRMVNGEVGPVVIDLEPYRETLLAPVEAISPELADSVPESWFHEVEVLEEGAIPDVSAVAGKSLSVAMAAAAIATALVGLILAAANRWVARLGAIGTSFLVAGGLSALAVPAGADTAEAVAAGTSRGVLISNLYTELTNTLTARSLILLLVGVALIGAASILWSARTSTRSL